MPRIIVVTDPRHGQTQDERIVFDEDVTRALLDDKYASRQIVERMAWALGDLDRPQTGLERTQTVAA
jgi:hypothetical protein